MNMTRQQPKKLKMNVGLTN